MKHILLVAVTVGASTCVHLGAAHASPSGLTVIPSTDFYARRVTHLNVSASRAGAPVSQQQASAGLSLGLGASDEARARRAFGQTEIGFDVGVFRLRDASGVRQPAGDSLVFNFKTLLFDNGKSGGRAVRVAAGGFNLGNRSSTRTGYAIASRELSRSSRAHLGVWRTFNQRALNGRNYTQVLVGYEKAVSPRLTLLADHASGNGPLGATGLSAIYGINDRSGIQIALVRPHSPEARAASGNYSLVLAYDVDFGPGAP
jgi:hypothetical protein